MMLKIKVTLKMKKRERKKMSRLVNNLSLFRIIVKNKKSEIDVLNLFHHYLWFFLILSNFIFIQFFFYHK